MTTLHILNCTQVPTLSHLQKNFPGLKAYLFDMDGTLFDTEKFHAEALIEIGHAHNIRPHLSPQELYNLMVGKADQLVFDIAKSWENFPKTWTVDDFVREKNSRLLKALAKEDKKKFFSKDIFQLIQDIKENNYFIGLVTSSEKVITQALLKQANLEHFFNFVLTRDDSLAYKPNPWPYKKAMETANVSIQETLIFEDSDVGLKAAFDSGANVIKASWYHGLKI